MSLVIPEDYINVHFGFAALGDPELAFTALGYHYDPGLLVTDVFGFAQDINDAWQGSFKAVISEEWTMTGSYVEVGNTSPPYVRADLTGTQAGEGTTNSLPNNCCALIKKGTSTAGRQGRGRMYVPGLVANSASVSGVLNPTERGQWIDALDEFNSLVSLLPPTLGGALFHDEAGPITAPSQIISMVVDNQIATQRKRMR